MTGSGEILSGGFSLLGKRPGAIAVWALAHAAVGLISVVFLVPRMLAAMPKPGAGGDADMATQMAAMQQMMGFQGLSWLLSIAASFLGAVILCAAFRAMLRPEEGGFASLKLGMDEVRVFAMMMVIQFGGAIVLVIVMMIAMLLGFLIWFAASNYPAIAILLIALLVIAVICAIIWAAVRLSLLFPMTFIRREFVIDEAWKLSRGRFWTLFVPFLVICLLMSLVSLVVMIPVGFAAFATLPALPAAEDPAAMQAFSDAIMQQWFGQPFGILAVLTLVSAVVQAVWTALNGGAMATAAQGFLHDDGESPEAIFG